MVLDIVGEGKIAQSLPDADQITFFYGGVLLFGLPHLLQQGGQPRRAELLAALHDQTELLLEKRHRQDHGLFQRGGEIERRQPRESRFERGALQMPAAFIGQCVGGRHVICE